MAMRSRNPQYPRNSDVPLKKTYLNFYGMLTGEPASELPDGYSALNKNVIDRGEYYDVRNGSRQYTTFKLGITISSVDLDEDTITLSNVHQWNTGDVVWLRGDGLPGPFQEEIAYYVIKVTNKIIKLAASYSNAVAGTAININANLSEESWIYYGEINAVEDHVGQNVVVMMLGNSIYVINKRMNRFTRVLNIESVDPSSVSSMFVYDSSIILFSSTGIFKIVLDDDFYWMYQINKYLPTIPVTDINESETLIYGYLYLYSMALLSGTGNRSRLDSEILFESGTVEKGSSGKDYGEVYFEYEVGVNLSYNNSLGDLTLPGSVNGITHFPLYRTRNIGENSGGSGTNINSIGNKRDFFIWVADIPVAKAFVIDTSTTLGTATIASGNKFVRGDATCVLKDAAGNTATISAYADEDNVTIGAGLASGTAIYCAIGGGRVMQCSQSGYVLTRSAGGTFATTDKGLLIFLSDGSYRHIVRYLTANTVEVAEDGDFIDYAGTLKPTSGNFSRKWNDTVSDDPKGDGRVAWEDFSLYGADLYIPRRFFKPIPNSNIGVINNGFVVCAIRGDSKYYYSQIGDKDYSMGYYIIPNQTKKISGSINNIVVFPSKVIIFTDKTTIEVILSSSSNIGRTSVGENIFELSAPNVVDTQRGVKAWKTVVFKNADLLFALCSDSSYRGFNGSVWGDDLSIINGKDAVSKEYLKLADQSYGINAFYSNFAGSKLWFRKWNELTNLSGAVYEMVQLTWTDTDINEQMSWDVFENRGQTGYQDMQSIIL